MAKRKKKGPGKAETFDPAAECDAAEAALHAAETVPDVLRALARGAWTADNGGPCPPERIPDTEALEGFAPRFGAGVWAEVARIVSRIYAAKGEQVDAAKGAAEFASWAAQGELVQLDYLDEMWRTLPEADRGKHPVAVIVRAWQNEYGRPVDANRRNDPIFPGPLLITDRKTTTGYLMQVQVPGTGRTGYLAGFGPGPDGAPELMAGALPLQMYDLGAGSKAAGTRGKGAPLALRLFVESVLAVPLTARTGRGRVMLPAIRWGELLENLYPGTAANWKAGKHLEAMLRAFNSLDSPEALIPWQNEAGGWQARRVVVVEDRPITGHRSEWVRFSVNLPPGSEQGPLIDMGALRRAGVVSDTAYRLALALSALWNIPGRLRFPVPGKRRGMWLQVRDVARYPEITLAQLVAFAYPQEAGEANPDILYNRRRKAKAALAYLASVHFCRVEPAPVDGRGPWRIMPGEAWAGWSEAGGD